jgi:hypothetical protein
MGMAVWSSKMFFNNVGFGHHVLYGGTGSQGHASVVFKVTSIGELSLSFLINKKKCIFSF